jgi:hypothetical protein
MNIVKKAALFAERAHQGQLRKYTGEPYIVHCQSVAMLILLEAINPSSEQLAAAILHDTLEDTQTTEQAIIEKFGEEWFDKHCKKNIVIEHKLLYNYESIVNYRNSFVVKKEVPIFTGIFDFNNAGWVFETYNKTSYSYKSEVILCIR